MRPLTITLDKNSWLKNGFIASFEGDFDGSTKENLDEIQREIDASTPGATVIFDFSLLNYLNSFALSQMVSWHNAIVAKEGEVVIVGSNDHIKDIFMVLGVESIFKIYATLEEAKNAIML